MGDEMIRDRLVVGIRDAALSRSLQLDAELTLEKAKKKTRQQEAIGEQQQQLNATVEIHPLPKVDETLAQLSGARIFSKLDANSEFWQIPLAKKSQHLTPFITPFGRYHFLKMPFGISSAPEQFQKRMSAIVLGLESVLCLLDDVYTSFWTGRR